MIGKSQLPFNTKSSSKTRWILISICWAGRLSRNFGSLGDVVVVVMMVVVVMCGGWCNKTMNHYLQTEIFRILRQRMLTFPYRLNITLKGCLTGCCFFYCQNYMKNATFNWDISNLDPLDISRAAWHPLILKGLQSWPYGKGFVFRSLGVFTGWCFRISLIFTPICGEDDQIWRAYFSDGLKPPTSPFNWTTSTVWNEKHRPTCGHFGFGKYDDDAPVIMRNLLHTEDVLIHWYTIYLCYICIIYIICLYFAGHLHFEPFVALLFHEWLDLLFWFFEAGEKQHILGTNISNIPL